MTLELLAPAGNFEKLKIAFSYGADAVYIAGREFGLRSAADNFSTEEIGRAVEYAQALGKKVYLAINAMLHDEEIKRLPDFLEQISKRPPHALIISDLGVIDLVREKTSIPIHLSTQASVLNRYHADLMKSAGVERIVVGREMSIEDTAKLGQRTGLETEMFIHGALCMSFSGNCTISNYVAGRDSNRGGCIQNCRYLYHFESNKDNAPTAHFMSSKDLKGLPLLADFIRYGITSVKIEGRMKSNLYIATTVGVYAQALRRIAKDPSCDLTELSLELMKIPHRDYTDGSLHEPADASSVYRHDRELESDYEMAGTVLEVDEIQNRFLFYSKNKIQKGDEIEILDFAGGFTEVRVDQMTDPKGAVLDLVQPHGLAWLPMQPGIQIKMVGRKKM